MDKELKRKVKTGIALAFLAALVAAFAHPDYRQGEPSIHGTPEHDFALTLDGKPTRLSDLRGRVVLVNFWASWCPPCRDEAPSLNELEQHMAPLGGMVLGIDPGVEEDEVSYRGFLETFHIDFPTYLDPSKQIALSYGTTMYPESYVIDRQGRIDRKIVGEQDWTSPAMLVYFDSVLSRR
ncbi:MAG TPA: TlpA disulfide reductase family protein [Candidatus Cybelea sp.]|nr:TlpA disulfide reductase family protein [Candidatus Cybelea sp.]